MENTKWLLTITFRIQSHHIQRWQKLLWILQKNSPKSCYLFTTNQLYPRNQRSISFKMSENVSEILTTKHENAFNGMLCLNSYPENNINQTNQRDSWSNNTEWSYLKIPYISEQLKPQDYQYFSEGRASQYELLKAQLHPQMSLLPHHCWAYMHQGKVPHLLHQFMQFTPSTRSHVLTAINYTLVGLFISSTIVLENILVTKILLWRNTSPYA